MGQKFANLNYNEANRPRKRNLDQDKNIARIVNTYAVLSRNCICRDLRTFSVVIFPSFYGNSNIFATFIFNRKTNDRIELLAKEQKAINGTKWIE